MGEVIDIKVWRVRKSQCVLHDLLHLANFSTYEDVEGVSFAIQVDHCDVYVHAWHCCEYWKKESERTSQKKK